MSWTLLCLRVSTHWMKARGEEGKTTNLCYDALLPVIISVRFLLAFLILFHNPGFSAFTTDDAGELDTIDNATSLGGERAEENECPGDPDRMGTGGTSDFLVGIGIGVTSERSTEEGGVAPPAAGELPSDADASEMGKSDSECELEGDEGTTLSS